MAFFGLIKDKAAKSKAAALPIMLELPAAQPDPIADALEPVELAISRPADPLLPTSDELLQMLFTAIASGDEPRLAALANDYHDFIVEFAPSWIMIPATLADNRPAAEWYMAGIDLIVTHYTTPPESIAAAPASDTLGA